MTGSGHAKQGSLALSLTDLLENNAMTAEMAAYMWSLIDGNAFGIITGVTGSGKTTLLSALASMINPRWFIITMEDVPEIHIPHTDWVRLNTRKIYRKMGSTYDITMKHLIDMSLTQRPDCSIVGEIKVKDMGSLFQAVETGHGGLTGFHASSAEVALTRMRDYKISNDELALLWFMAHSGVMRRDGHSMRKVLTISQMVRDRSGEINVDDVFRYNKNNDRFEAVRDPLKTELYLKAADKCGIYNHKHDMRQRIELLKRCVSENAHTPAAISRMLGQYYEQ